MSKLENRYIHLFEDFMTEVTATAVQKQDIKVPKSIEEKSMILEAGLEEYQKGLAEFKKKFDPIISTNEKLTQEIEEDLRKLGVLKIKIHKMAYEMKHTAGRLTDSYKTLWETCLTKFNATIKASMLKLQAESKHQNPDKDWMEATLTDESINIEEALTWKDVVKKGGDLLMKAKNWIAGAWNKIKGGVSEISDQTEMMEKLFKECTESVGESVTVNEESSVEGKNVRVEMLRSHTNNTEKVVISLVGNCNTKQTNPQMTVHTEITLEDAIELHSLLGTLLNI